MGFTLGQSVYGIGHQPAGVADLGMNRGVGGAKADSYVARLIHRGAAHPAPGRIRLVGALLKTVGAVVTLRSSNQRTPATPPALTV